jgi:nucleoside-diphosphate-sugar epimerase
MRVFVTGATGFVGSVVVKELIGAGHQVLGLARSEESANSLIAAGAEVHHGTLEDLDSLRSGAAAADGVIHCAFIHDFTKFQENCEKDRAAVEAIGAVLKGTNKPFIITSGAAGLKPGELATEEDAGDPATSSPRAITEGVLLAMAADGVRAMVMRLPPSVHGDGDHGFVPWLINIAREKGTSAYVGEGQNRWPTVHRLDAAKAYRLALEKGTAGTRYHAVGEEGVPCRQIAETIGKHLDMEVVSKTKEEAPAHFGFLGNFFGADCPASSRLTQERLGWQPTQPHLLEDMAAHYFKK